jgi:hypothetical protein
MTRSSIGVNLTWCVPGGVGGSEQYLVRQVLGLVEIGAPYDLTVYAPRGFAAAHPDVAAAVRTVEAPSDCRSRALRVALENAVSVSSVLLLTEATMTEIPDERKERAPEPTMGM